MRLITQKVKLERLLRGNVLDRVRLSSLSQMPESEFRPPEAQSAFRRFTYHETAIKWALKERVSGEGGDRGNGLPDLLRTAAKQGGRLVLRSGFGMVYVRVGQQAYERFSTEHFEIPGTYAWLKAKLPPSRND